jgi:hypothetical protein
MNMQNSFKLRSPRVLLPFFLAVALATVGSTLWASPPKRQHVPEPLEKIGNFFFNLARTLERVNLAEGDEDVEIIYDARRRTPLSVEVVPAPREEPPPTGIVVPPGYRGGYYDPGTSARVYPRREMEVPPGYQPYREPVLPPRFQPNPQPRSQDPRIERREDLSDLDRRLEPQERAAVEDTRPGARRSGDASNQVPFNPPSSPPTKSKSEKQQGDGAKAQANVAEPGFATPVPGHNGFVYPPGVEHDSKNMLDVRDFAPGQKVKDPRTGQMFLVPPK